MVDLSSLEPSRKVKSMQRPIPVGTRFLVNPENTFFKAFSIVKLVEDDGTATPKFELVQGGFREYAKEPFFSNAYANRQFYSALTSFKRI